LIHFYKRSHLVLAALVMDAIRKKMQSMKAETDDLYQRCSNFTNVAKEANTTCDKLDAEIRDLSKKVQKYECNLEETIEKLQASDSKYEIAEKEFLDKDDDVNAQCRRCVLMETEASISVEKLASTILKLAHMSKDADKIVKGMREWESKTMNNEVELEGLDKNTREARRIASENEMKYDNLARSLAMMEDELRRADERVKNAESRVVTIEDELSAIGENQKQLEVSEEKARRREEKYQDQIKQLNIRLKQSDSRSEYAEMNISKLHHRIDELEDEIIREKLKINAVSGQLDDTFNEMLNKY